MPGAMEWVQTLGPGIQTYFSYASYNQNALKFNITWRQVQAYQKKNYNLGWIAIARKDILSMMSISINRINNYLIVAALIVGVASGTLWSVRFNSTQDDVEIILAFYANVSLSLIYLFLSISLGIKGQNKAFYYTLRLLTFHIRPENPAEYNHDYMKQMQWIERLGIPEMFRIPGLMPSMNHHQEEHEDLLRANPDHAGSAEYKSFQKMKGHRIEDFTALENLDVKSAHTWYLSRYSDYMQLWLWYDKYARLTMGLGVICLLQGGMYYLVWRINNLSYDPNRYDAHFTTVFNTVLILLVMLSTLLVLIKTNMSIFEISWVQVAWLIAMFSGPVLGSMSVFPEELALEDSATAKAVEYVLALLCYLSHLIYWVLTLVLHLFDAKINTERRFVLGNFWSEAKAQKGINVDHERERDGPPEDGDVEIEVGGVLGSAKRQEQWPTQGDTFNEKVKSARDKIKWTISSLLVTTIAFWVLIIAGVTIAGLESEEFTSFFSEAIPFASAQDFPAAFLTTNDFHPQSMTCAMSTMFVADDHHVFRVDKGVLEPASCNMRSNATIADITAVCDTSSRCTPVVLQLIDEQFSSITDCHTGVSGRLLQEIGPADHISIRQVSSNGNLFEQRLIAAQGGKLMQYMWSQSRQAWMPEYPLGPIQQDAPADPFKRGADVEVHSMTTGDLNGMRGTIVDVRQSKDTGEEVVVEFPRPVDMQIVPKKNLKITEDENTPSRLIAMASVDSSLLLFYHVWNGGVAVERRDLNTMQTGTFWQIASAYTPTFNGCAMDPQSVLVLFSSGTDRGRRLVHLWLA